MPIVLVQQIPKPTVHAALDLDTHLADLKPVRSIAFEESRSPDELEGRSFPLADKRGISQSEFQCSVQAYFRARSFFDIVGGGS